MSEEVVTTGAGGSGLGGMSKQDLDAQFIMARQFRRSVSKFMKDVETLACVNEEVAAGCIYSIPRRDKRGAIKNIEGPTVRLAEIVASQWTNCRYGARVVEEAHDYVTAQGVFHDLENNVAVSVEVRRRITDSGGNRFSPDMITVTANAAISIALRGAVMRGVPRAFWDSAYEKARKVMAGDAKTIANRRLEMLDFLAKMGVGADKVFHRLEVRGIEDMTVDHLATLRATVTAIREGDVTLEEAFPDPNETPADEKAPTKGMAGLKAALTAKPAEATKPEPQVSTPASVTLSAESKAPGAEDARPVCGFTGCMVERDADSDFCGEHKAKKQPKHMGRR